MPAHQLALDLSVSLFLAVSMSAGCSTPGLPGGPDPDGGLGGAADGGDAVDDCGAGPAASSAYCSAIDCHSGGAQMVCQGGVWTCPVGTAVNVNCGCRDFEYFEECVSHCASDDVLSLGACGRQPRCPDGMISVYSCQGAYCPAPEPVPDDEPSRQTVRFTFGAAPGWLVTEGTLCGPLQLERIKGPEPVPLVLGLPPEVACQDPASPPPAGPRTLVDLSGGTAVLSWDVRHLETREVCVECGTVGGIEGKIDLTTAGGFRAAGWLPYRATFAVADDPSSFGCEPDPIETVSCSPEASAQPGDSTAFGLCRASRTVSVEFEVPETGDLEVAVP